MPIQVFLPTSMLLGGNPESKTLRNGWSIIAPIQKEVARILNNGEGMPNRLRLIEARRSIEVQVFGYETSLRLPAAVVVVINNYDNKDSLADITDDHISDIMWFIRILMGDPDLTVSVLYVPFSKKDTSYVGGSQW